MDKFTEKHEENKTKGSLVSVQCIECKRDTRHQVVQSLDYYSSDECGFFYVVIYQIIQCQGCMSITFRQLSHCSDDIVHIGHDKWEYETTEVLYPKRSKFTLPIKDFLNLPNNLRRIYRETVESFNNESFTLSAAGLRALVEGLCVELNIKDGPKEIENSGVIETKRLCNLEGKIAGLHEKGFLTQKNSSVLHEHRYLGNQALHELAQPTRDELELAIQIIEHTFESVYEIPDKAEGLRIKRANRNK